MAVAVNAARQLDDDAELVARTRAGDERAFGELFSRYRAPITAFLAARLRDHGRAEEVAQDVFVSALRAMRRDDRPIAFRAWIYEIARNACIDAHRRSRGAEEVPLELGGDLPFIGLGPEASYEAKMRLEQLQGAFDGLNDTHHQVLVLRELEGRSYREIGERLGMTRPSVESALFRARRRLETEYTELESGERCREVQHAVSDLEVLAGLSARGRARVEGHLTWCRQCRQVAGHQRALRRGGLLRKAAALLPLPAFLRDRWAGADSALASSSTVAQQSASVASGPLANTAAAASQSLSAASTSLAHIAEPATGWAKAAIAAAVVTVGGMSATATTPSPDVLGGVTPAPALIRDAGDVLPSGLADAVGTPFGSAQPSPAAPPPGAATLPLPTEGGTPFSVEADEPVSTPVIATPFGDWPAGGPLVAPVGADPALVVGGDTPLAVTDLGAPAGDGTALGPVAGPDLTPLLPGLGGDLPGLPLVGEGTAGSGAGTVGSVPVVGGAGLGVSEDGGASGDAPSDGLTIVDGGAGPGAGAGSGAGAVVPEAPAEEPGGDRDEGPIEEPPPPPPAGAGDEGPRDVPGGGMGVRPDDRGPGGNGGSDEDPGEGEGSVGGADEGEPVVVAPPRGEGSGAQGGETSGGSGAGADGEAGGGSGAGGQDGEARGGAGAGGQGGQAGAGAGGQGGQAGAGAGAEDGGSGGAGAGAGAQDGAAGSGGAEGGAPQGGGAGTGGAADGGTSGGGAEAGAGGSAGGGPGAGDGTGAAPDPGAGTVGVTVGITAPAAPAQAVVDTVAGVLAEIEAAAAAAAAASSTP